MRTLFGAVFLLLATPFAQAWGNKGHEVVAYIAYMNLDAATRQEVDRLVTLNPCFSQWKKEVLVLPASQQSVGAFMLAVTWPDRIKNIPHEPPYDCQPDHKFILDGGPSTSGSGISQDVPPDSPEASQNIGYGDTRRHQYWHFIDTPFSPDGTNVEPAYTPNALTELLLLAKALHSDEGDDLKSYDMVWVSHLVGDVHQPLHDTTRFTAGHPNGDQGGNALLICVTAGCSQELHSYWDDLPGPGNDLAAAVALGVDLNRQAPPDDDTIDIENPADWVTQGFNLAKSAAYAPPISVDAAGGIPTKPDAVYSVNAKQIMRNQLFLAGHRLAFLLTNYLS